MLLLAPMSAYQLKKAMEGSISHFYSAAHSQVYQQASRLVRDGYVREKEAPGGRRKRILSLTPKGRQAVLEWLRAPEADDQLYSELLVKTFFASYADDPGAMRTMLERRREESEAMLAWLRAVPARPGGGGRQPVPGDDAFGGHPLLP